jgi:octaprenyl-diphosphate synthase
MRVGSYAEFSRHALLAVAEQTGALESAHRRASEFAENARRALEQLPPSPYRDALGSIPTFILERDR